MIIEVDPSDNTTAGTRIDGVHLPLSGLDTQAPPPMVGVVIQHVLTAGAREVVRKLVAEIERVVEDDRKRAQEQYAREPVEVLHVATEPRDCPHCGRPDTDEGHRLRCMEASHFGEEPPP